MPENWSAIAAEVEEALRSVADVSQPDGFPVTLRKQVTSGGNPWDPGSGTTTATYMTFYAIMDMKELHDINGTLIGQTKKTLTVNATAGVVPSDDDMVALGIAAEQAGEDSPWVAIVAVRPLAPAGVVVLYELDLAA
jgi:hypothetical protein